MMLVGTAQRCPASSVSTASKKTSSYRMFTYGAGNAGTGGTDSQGAGQRHDRQLVQLSIFAIEKRRVS